MNPENFLQIVLNTGFIQLITKATRLQNNHASLIDNILTNAPCSKTSSGIIVNDISDHFLTFCQPNYSKIAKPPLPQSKRNFSKDNITQFKNALRNVSWNDCLRSNDVDESYSFFWDNFKILYDLHFPKIPIQKNKNKNKIKNFLTKGLLISRNTKNKLYKLQLSNPSETNKSNYKKYRNIFNSTVRKSKILYFEKSFENSRKNPKQTWQTLKEAANLNISTNCDPELKINDKIITDPLTIANSFNSHFSSIGTKISNEIPPSEIDPLSYCHDFPDLRHLELGGVGPIYVIDIVKAMTSKTSTDLDDISTKFLKSIIGEIALPLSHIFDLSLSSGTFPSRLKASRVVPIFKGGDPLLTDNYRPISLVNAISKILEKIVYHKLVNHLEINKLLYQHQYGFLKGKSTEHALLQILNQIGTALNNNKYCLGVFLDLKKAFDTVPHDILLKKLVKLGITGTTLNWFKSYLSGRTQKVDINGQLSDSCDIDISVLQGTILGPILFLCYINDLPNATDLFSILYADDTTALDSDDDLDVLINRINLELKKLANWFRSNKMQLNVNKTKYIIFHVPSKKINTNLKLVIDENSEDLPFNQSLVTPIERIHNKHENVNSRSFKLLGIYLDENLNFNANTAELTKKLSRAAFFIKRVKNTLSTKVLKMFLSLPSPLLPFNLQLYL